MNQETQIDQSIIGRIRMRDTTALTHLYKEVYPMVRNYIQSNSGNSEDAQDVFQDACYVLIKKCESAEFILTSQISTYLFAVSKKIWLKKLGRTKLERVQVDAETETEDDFVNQDFDEEKLSRVRQINFALSSLGEPCKSLLHEFYYVQRTMQEIAERFHYTNAENAKNQKYKCLQRLKKLIYGHD